MSKLLLLLLLASQVSFAADSATVNASAVVNGSCKFKNSSNVLDFGSIRHTMINFDDNSLKRQVELLFECTQGLQSNVSSPTSANGFKLNLLGGGSDSITYTAVRNGVTTFVGKGYGNIPLVQKIDVSINKISFFSVREGTYEGTFTVNVNY